MIVLSVAGVRVSAVVVDVAQVMVEVGVFTV
jgi:hypothetical protein